VLWHFHLKVKVHFHTGNLAAALSLLALLSGILLSSCYSCSILRWARHEPQSSSLALSNLPIYMAFLQPTLLLWMLGQHTVHLQHLHFIRLSQWQQSCTCICTCCGGPQWWQWTKNNLYYSRHNATFEHPNLYYKVKMNAALQNENKEQQLQTDLPSSTQNTIQVSNV